MNLKNFLTLTIRSRDFNLVAQQPELMKKLRKLTLHSYSGLNKEMNRLLHLMQERKVTAQVLLAYRDGELIAWALLSKEKSSMIFSNTMDHFNPSQGVLFEVYVHPDYRRQGIASELIKVARRKAGAYKLCVAPWDKQSREFYQNFQHYQTKWL